VGAVSIFLGAVIPFFPDLHFLLRNGIMILFFLSGIFFDINQVDEPYKTWFYLNPMVSLIESYRDILLNGLAPGFMRLAMISFFSILLGIVGILILNKKDRYYPRLSI